MIIGFIGDTHGRVFHAIAAAVTWQIATGKQFDLLIHVGDLGAFPDLDQADPTTIRHLAADPAEADFSRLLKSQGKQAEILQALRTRFATPIYFVRGNHEDFAWLNQLPVDPHTQTATVDPFGFFRYVPDGTVFQFDALQVAFLGGVEEQTDAAAIDRTAYDALMKLEPGAVDLLVTHQGPYRYSTNQDFQPFNLVEELTKRQLFKQYGEQHTAPVPFQQSIASYVESIHSRKGFSRERMTPENAQIFDGSITRLLSNVYSDRRVRLEVVGHIVWGKPR